MTSVTHDGDITTYTMVHEPADGDGLSLVDMQQSGQRLLMRRTPLGGAGAVRQGFTVAVSDPAVLDGIAAGLRAGPVAFTLGVGGTSRSATMTSVGNEAVRMHVENLADVTLPLGSAGDTTTSAMTGPAMGVVVGLVLIVAAVGALIVLTDSQGGECEVEAKPDPRPPTGGNPG